MVSCQESVSIARIAMANRPFIYYDAIVNSASDGGYGSIKSLSQLSLAFLLSALIELEQRFIYETSIDPISDAKFAEISQTIAQINYELQRNMIGQIISSVTVLSDDSLLLCDGTTYNESDYPDLFSVVPNSWKLGSTFTIPDLTDTYLVQNLVGLGDIVGENEHTLDVSEMPPHTHSYSSDIIIPVAALVGAIPVSLVVSSSSVTGSSGSGLPHNNKPLSMQVLFYIVAR